MKDYQILDPYFNRKTVRGHIYEPFGIHKDTYWYKWSITHLNTGTRLARVHTLKEAKQLIKELKNLGNLEIWENNYTIKDLYKHKAFLQRVVDIISKFTGRKRILKEDLKE